ncbi:hypothetical protein C9J60_18515 [Streptomyces sp. A244]|nr:hypothetical protein C9J60_18515 [Streptomyces sp. A244]
MRQVHKMPYDRNVMLWPRTPPDAPFSAPTYTDQDQRASAVWAASRQLHAYTRALRAIRNGMSSRSQEAGA